MAERIYWSSRQFLGILSEVFKAIRSCIGHKAAFCNIAHKATPIHHGQKLYIPDSVVVWVSSGWVGGLGEGGGGGRGRSEQGKSEFAPRPHAAIHFCKL